MSDNKELKRLAAAIESCTSIPEQDEAAWMRRTTGRAVVELFEELENFKAEISRQAKQFKEWQASHHANYVRASEERDHLKAENAGLKTGYEAYEQVVQGLKAEVEALRKNADRYRWLQQWYIEGRKRSEIHPDGHICFTTPAIMDAAIDTALSKGEQS